MSVHRRLGSKKPGVSLVELLVAVSASVIIAGVVSGVFINSWNAQIDQEAYTELQQKGRIAIDEISSTVKSSSGVVTTISSGGNTYTTSSNTIVLKTPALDSSSNILAATDHFVFQLNGSDPTKLERVVIADPSSARVSLGTNTTLNDAMGSLTISYYDSAGSPLTPGTDDITTTTSVLIDVNSQKNSGNQTINRSFDNLVYLRNLP